MSINTAVALLLLFFAISLTRVGARVIWGGVKLGWWLLTSAMALVLLFGAVWVYFNPPPNMSTHQTHRHHNNCVRKQAKNPNVNIPIAKGDCD